MSKHVREFKKIINGNEHYYCSRCKTYKIISEMYINFTSLKRRDFSCKNCATKRVTKYRHDNPEKRILNDARKRALNRNLEFNIELSDIIIPTHCPLLEIPLNTKATVKERDFSPSLDRIDINKGYIKGNIRVISFLANAMKRDVNKILLLKFSKNLPEYMT